LLVLRFKLALLFGGHWWLNNTPGVAEFIKHTDGPVSAFRDGAI
jgi:hypothetical protein